MAEIPKLIEFGDMGIQKIAISEQDEASTEISDSFIVDIESLSHGSTKDMSANSRISVKLQRNLSRKGSQRGGEREKNKTSPSASSGVAVTDASVNDTGESRLDSTTPAENLGTINKQPQQTITIKTENRCSRRYSKQRTSSSFIDPRRVLLFFATLSSMGTMILIYLTLFMAKFSGDSNIQAQ